MWNSEKSAKLSLYITDILMGIFVIAGVFLPKLAEWYVELACKSADIKTVLIIVCYSCIPFALLLLFFLRKILKNIMKEIIFDTKNVKLLRIISWLCVAICVITLVSGYFYFLFYFIAAAAGFFALILRVIKNVFQAAIEIKTENELTI